MAYGERAGERAAELAVHFERGRDYRKAVQYLQQAGENAVRRSANQEAVILLTKGLELLKRLPDTPEHTPQELALQMALCPSLVLSKGFAAPEVEKTLVRARELCRQLGDTPQLFWVLARLSAVHLARGELQTVYAIGEQLLTLAQRLQDPTLSLSAHATLGTSLYWRGELAAARAHLERGIALYDPHRLSPYTVIQDPGVACLSLVAGVLWLLGYPEQALARSRAALTLAQECSHPHNLVFAQLGAGWLRQLRQEGQAAQEQIEAVMALCREQGFLYWLAVATVARGGALVQQGQEEEGIVQICQGLAAWQAIGAELNRPSFLAMLAEAYGKVGQTIEGLTALAEALAVVDKTGERWYEAELHRLKGELTLQKGTRDLGLGTGPASSQAPSLKPLVPSEVAREAEEYFLKVIEISRKQHARSLELRATMSLVRLRQHQAAHYGSRNTQHVTRHKLAEAHKMLSEIYNWFTEGFDTKDLQEAKALIEELSH